MKVFLMFKNRDFAEQQKLPPNEQTLIQDLELKTMFNAMALGDSFLLKVVRKAVLSGLHNDISTILYRQNILKDCLKNSYIVRDIYAIVETFETKNDSYFGFVETYPSSILNSSRKALQRFMIKLVRLKEICDKNADNFESEGFILFFTMIKRELNDEYLACIQRHINELEFYDKVLLSVELGEGNKGSNYKLCKSLNNSKNTWKRMLPFKKQHAYTFTISDNDIPGAKFIKELKDRGINTIANVLAQSADHIDSFFYMLKTELAFYIASLNLHEQLIQINAPTSFPLPTPHHDHKHLFQGLYDACLSLTIKQNIIGNDLKANNTDLTIITGSNQGGKSTFLRSIGLSQLMMQCGMFVPAEYYSSNLCDNIFTHYKREEDVSMRCGKLEEELSRMSDIADYITSNSILLFNESFAATNEREGSEIAMQIVRALQEKHIKIFFVTHLYDFAHSFYEKKMENIIFLRAERQGDGSRTFKIVEGEPLQTSYGKDLYKKIFETNNPTINLSL